MQKIHTIIFSLVLGSLSLTVYPFWIWSPKTQKWKNPQYSPLATPYLQFKEAEKSFNNKQYKAALKEFKKVLVHYPDSKEAADAQYYIGRCLEELRNPYQAFMEYQKVIDSYPNSKRINEVVEREYAIGEYFLNREPKKWLGVSVYDLTEHPSLEIFKKIVEKAPYSTFASQAQYKLGLLLMQLGRYDEARDAFQKVLDTYPESEWASPSKYQLAIATSKASFGADYDSTAIQEATKRLDEFIKKHPDADISPQAAKQLKELRDKEAKKNFDIGDFYETQGRYESAIIYYKVVMAKYSDSDYNAPAEKKVNLLTDLIENKISKSQFKKLEKQESREQKKSLHQDDKDVKRREKQQRYDEKKTKKEEARQLKIKTAQEKKAAKLRAKQERAQEKKRKKQAAGESVTQQADVIVPNGQSQETSSSSVPQEQTPVVEERSGLIAKDAATESGQKVNEPASVPMNTTESNFREQDVFEAQTFDASLDEDPFSQEVIEAEKNDMKKIRFGSDVYKSGTGANEQ